MEWNRIQFYYFGVGYQLIDETNAANALRTIDGRLIYYLKSEGMLSWLEIVFRFDPTQRSNL